VEESEFHIQVPEDENQEILEIIPFQLLAYRTSVKKGNNPDKPRNLAKSVTGK
jgi:glucosamine--fructose-6-phosphate aminotransferase (isomerizing)